MTEVEQILCQCRDDLNYTCAFKIHCLQSPRHPDRVLSVNLSNTRVSSSIKFPHNSFGSPTGLVFDTIRCLEILPSPMSVWLAVICVIGQGLKKEVLHINSSYNLTLSRTHQISSFLYLLLNRSGKCLFCFRDFPG